MKKQEAKRSQQVTRKLSDIAQNIEAAWSTQGKGVNYAARPYLDAMYQLEDINDRYGLDSAGGIVRRFLANASSFKGEAAKTLKAELKELLKLEVVTPVKLNEISLDLH